MPILCTHEPLMHCKAHTFQLVKVQAEERSAISSEPNLTSSLTASCRKAKAMKYEAAAQQWYVIRFVPSLNLAALKARPRKDNQLLLWYCLRAIDTTGRGVLDQEMTTKLLRTVFNYKRQTIYKYLKAGNNVFWRRHISRKGRSVIILRSLARVACYLKANINTHERFVQLQLSELPPPGRVQARRALLYNSGAYKPPTTHPNHPISRKSLTEQTGIEDRQQRRYDQIMEAHGVVRERTFAYYRDRNTRKLKALVSLVETERGDVLTYELPNRYQTPCLGGSRGMLPKVARLVRATKESCIRGEATSDTNHRRYYRSRKSLNRAALKGTATAGYYPSRSSPRKYIFEIV